jgi:hypothetical protein
MPAEKAAAVVCRRMVNKISSGAVTYDGLHRIARVRRLVEP